MTINNAKGKIKICDTTNGKKYKITAKCDSSFLFEFVLKGQRQNFMLPGRISSESGIYSISFIAPDNGILYLISSSRFKWETAEIEISEE